MKLALWLFAGVACCSAQVNDALIVPGERVGPVSRQSTEQSLLRALGKQAVKEAVDVGEGMTEPGLVLYKSSPTRRLAVIWNSDKPAHPFLVFICYHSTDQRCRWRTASGISFGTTRSDLERRNGKPLIMEPWGSDVGGNIVSYQGGKLEAELQSLRMTLEPRKLDPQVGRMWLEFPR